MVPGDLVLQDDPWVTDSLRRHGIICRHTRSPGGYRSARHRHAGTGLLYCQDGQGTFVLGDRSFPYSSGTLILFDSRIPHHVVMESTYSRWDLCFLPESFAPLRLDPGGYDQVTLSLEGTARIFRVLPEQAERLQTLFHQLATEAAERRLGYERMIQLLLAELQILLARLQLTEETPASAPAAGGSGARAHRLADAILMYIEEHLDEPLSVETIARRFHYNPSQIYRIVTKATGLTPSQYIKARRIARARLLLAQTDLSVTEVARQVGFASVSHFCRLFRKETGCTPGHYRASVS